MVTQCSGKNGANLQEKLSETLYILKPIIDTALSNQELTRLPCFLQFVVTTCQEAMAVYLPKAHVMHYS